MKHAIVAFGLIALLAPVTLHADPIGIRVLDATYSTTITFGINEHPSFPYVTTTVAGSNPVSQSATFYEPAGDVPGDTPILSTASASADWLAVSASSGSNYLCPCMPVSSSTEFEMMFSPLTNGLVPMEIIGEEFGPYSQTSITLFNVTDGQEMWRVEGVGWGSHTYAQSAPLSASHLYRLHLSLAGESLADSTRGTVRVSGVYAVPEPSSLLLLVTGLAGVGVFRRARTRKSRASEHPVA